MKIIKYINFGSSKEFEDWQRESDRLITSIQLSPRNINISDCTNNKTEAMFEVGCFVIYVEENDTLAVKEEMK